MAKYVMALDAGTTSNRCILFNEKGNSHSITRSRAGSSMTQARSGRHSSPWHVRP